MSKIKIQRYSGKPVDPVAAQNWEAERKVFFDATARQQAKVGDDVPVESINFAQLDMKAMQETLAEFDKGLDSRYEMFQTVSLPTSVKGWAKLQDKYESPILIAQEDNEAKKFILVVMDLPFG